MLRPFVILVIVLGLLAAACAGSGDPASGVDPGSSDPGVTTPDSSEAPSGPEGPAAPDFTLALGTDGSDSFTLSEGAMPVYMVFWAEW
jgi:hypothetical protein